MWIKTRPRSRRVWKEQTPPRSHNLGFYSRTGPDGAATLSYSQSTMSHLYGKSFTVDEQGTKQLKKFETTFRLNLNDLYILY